MNVSLYQAAAALDSTARWQELVSENLAASSVPGFKRQELSFSAVQAGLMAPSSVAGSQRFFLPGVTSTTNFTPGQMKFTGCKTDLAIDGAGFFEIQLPGNQTGYTRDGEFRINEQGQLVNKEGYPVISDRGPIQTDRANPAPLTISATGEVSQGTVKLGKLKLTTFSDPRLLTRTGTGYYLADSPAAGATNATGVTVRQGFLEAANTSAVTEMANLITAMRHYEANQRIIQMQDERMGRVITELGGTN